MHESTFSAEEIVAALYRTILLREPDEPGLVAHAATLRARDQTIEQLVKSFFSSEEFRTLGPTFAQAHTGAPNPRFLNDHTQFGELEILLRLWVNQAARHRIVVDVGANGRERSNSYDLLRTFGWKGLLIEANPALIGSIETDFAGLDIVLLHGAVSDYEGRATLHLGINADVSSLTQGNTAAWGPVQGTVTVDVRTLAPLLQQHAIPPDFDLLSLDIEGEDIKVLNNLLAESAFRPAWVIIEASHDFATRALADVGASAATQALYTIAGQTRANLILRLRPPAAL